MMLMEPQSTLSIAAEIGIGVAGFSSIAAAILSRSITDDLDVFWVQLQTLLRTSLAVALLAYLPMVLGSTSLPEPLAWRIGSAVYALWAILVIVIGFSSFRRLLSISGSTRRFAFVTLVLGFTSVGLNLSNAAFLGLSWPYLAALACGITIAFIQFTLLVRGLWVARASSAD